MTEISVMAETANDLSKKESLASGRYPRALDRLVVGMRERKPARPELLAARRVIRR